MKVRFELIMLCIIFLAVSLIGCDPKYPPGDLKVEHIETMSVGDSVAVEIVYPNTGGSFVTGWKDEKIEIIDGDSIVSADGLTITALEKGNATIEVSATTVISEEASKDNEERVYSTVVEIKVE